MKSRRRADWLVVGLMGLSLLVAPATGWAGPYRWREDPPPTMGDPDTPPSSPAAIQRKPLRVVRVVVTSHQIYVFPLRPMHLPGTMIWNRAR